MAGTDSQTSGHQKRESTGPENEHSGVILQGECHDTSNGLLYAVRLVFPAAAADDLASLEDVLRGVSQLLGHECSISLRKTSGSANWPGDF